MRITGQGMEMARERDVLNHPKEGTMSRRKLITLLAALTLVAPLMFYGCSGDDGAAGAPGKDAVSPSAAINLESCAICHNDQTIRNGDAHQADYDQRFQDNVVAVTPGSMTYTYINRATDN